jgi:hypothetical protein
MPAVWWCRTIKVNGGLVGEELAGRMALRLWYVSAPPPQKKFFFLNLANLIRTRHTLQGKSTYSCDNFYFSNKLLA